MKFFCSRLRRSQVNFIFGGNACRKCALFSRSFWCILTSVSVWHVLSTFWSIFSSLTLFSKPSKFSARAFGARKLTLFCGRNLQRRNVIFQGQTLMYFDFRVRFAHSTCVMEHFSGYRCENSPIFLLSSSAFTKLRLFFCRDAPKMSDFQWAILMHFLTSVCVLGRFEYTRGSFSAFRCECP